MPNPDHQFSALDSLTSKFKELIKFLLEPLVDNPQSLTIDCEIVPSCQRLWIRVAFEQEDKGKVFGRSGRNLKAIETLLSCISSDPNLKIYLDVFGAHANGRSDSERSAGGSRSRRGDSRRSRSSKRSRPPKPTPQLRNAQEN